VVDDTDPPAGVTLDEVARAAGVSRATASRAINGSGPVSRRAGEAVDRAVRELAFVPNRAAQTLATRRTDAITLVMPEPNTLVFSDPFISATIQGVSMALAESRYSLLLLMARPGGPDEKTLEFLHRGHVDGAIVVSHHRGDKIEETLRASKLPAVLIGRPWRTEQSGLPCVDVDNAHGGYLAGNRLASRGRKKVACIAGPDDMRVAMDRRDGWFRALAEAGLEPGPLIHGTFTLEDGIKATQRLIRENPKVDAIFAQSELLAAGAIRALGSEGRSVPDDVAVVGFDNSGVSLTTSPQLTSVTNPAAEMAERAAALLLAQLSGESVGHTPELLTPVLVPRESG
jgi:DNA-binding LacI/PurR family transcriptional regulator